jgi:arylsulfatase A-like enzyme
MKRLIIPMVAAALGGAWAGALVGFLEATLVAATGRPEEYWLFAFAIFFYGLAGIALGLASGVALRLLNRADGAGGVFGVAGATAFFPLAFVVARYHVIQRLFHEELVTFSATGLGVHLALLAAAAALAVAVFFLGRTIVRGERGLTAATAALAFLFAASAGAAVVASSGAARPAYNRSSSAHGANVILIIADTLRGDAVSPRLQLSPDDSGLARLAADGVVFEKAYAQSTWTRPSIATILSSLYPSQHEAVHKMDPLPDGVLTLPEALREEGYWTAGIVSNINLAPIFNFQQGFGEYEYLEPEFYFGASDSSTRLAIYKGLRVMRERLFGNYIYFSNYYQDAAVVGDRVQAWLDEKPPEPFFLLIHYMDPHDPYFEIPYNGRGVARVANPNPAAERAAELKGLYDQDVAYLDGHLSAILQDLQRRGLYENSAIALTADHGEEFHEHGGWWHGTTLYEEQLHVPLIIKRPNEPKPGERNSNLVRTLDIAPTLMMSVGLEVPEPFAGVNLFSAAGSGGSLYAEEDLEGNVLSALRHADLKLITANQNNPRGLKPLELYDLAQDPLEKRNLAEERPQEVARMLHLLEKERRRVLR